MINVLILNGADQHIQSVARALRQSKEKNVTLWIERNMVGVPPYCAWKDKHVIDDRVGALANMYFEWDITSRTATILTNEMRCMWWRMKIQNADFCILSAKQQPKQLMVMFEDSMTDDTFPQAFEKLKCFNDYDGLMNYFRERGDVNFSLHNIVYFKHEHDIPTVKGAEVYRELATDRLWYFDTFHKDHYEVFDKRGRIHLGEANMKGEFDASRADSTKNPIVR